MDIIILGGGIAGLTLANLLAKNSSLRIAVIDKQATQLEWDSTYYDIRCSAIAAASEQIFASIDVWQAILAERVGYYDQMLVWDREPQVKLEFLAKDIAVEKLGHIIENRVILRALYNKLNQQPNVEFIYEAPTNIEFTPEYVNLHLVTRNVMGKLIVGADGANSWLRSQAEIAVASWDYQHSALVATVKSQLQHANTARQRFMSDGPLAFLPLDKPHLSSIVWSSAPAKIDSLLKMPPAEFCKNLTEEFAFQLGELELHGERKSFPLRMLHAEQYVKSRLALIGDAAHVIHPLAGQGLNLGIKDAAVLAGVLLQAHSQEQDLGKLVILRKYERSRKGHNISMLALMEGIKRGFAVENTTFSNLRYGGINGINNLNFIKNTMMRFAIGV